MSSTSKYNGGDNRKTIEGANEILRSAKVTLNVDEVGFLEKPTKNIVGGIRNRLAKGTKALTVYKLMQYVESGCSFTPAEMAGTDARSWKSQQIIIADVDNDEPLPDEGGNEAKNADGRTMKKPVDRPLSSESALRICKENGITPAFMYHSFSNTPDLEKFRVVCVLDRPVDSAAEGVELTSRLYELLERNNPGALDHTMADPARLLYGSTEGSVFYMGDSLTSIEALRALPQSSRPAPSSVNADLISRDADEFLMPSNTALEYIDQYRSASWLKGWFTKYEVPTLRTIERGDGTMIYAVVCPWCDKHSEDTGERQSAVIIRPNGQLGYACQHAHCRDRTWKEYRAFYEGKQQASEDAALPVQTVTKGKLRQNELTAILKELHPESNSRYRWSDIGNGNLFADVFKEIARYCPDRGVWYVYDGKRWRPDSKDGTQVMQLCKRLADALIIYSSSVDNEKYPQAAAKWQSRSTRTNILKDAQDCYPVSMNDFDEDVYLLNCKNGTLDLRSFDFKAHDPKDMISKLANVSYDPEARCERWYSYINEIMQGDTEKIRFLQKALGYALTGDTKEECFFILYGSTSRNGKSVLMESFKNLIGDYGKATSPESIAQKDRTDSTKPSEDIARLAGARFVNISEPDKNMVLSSALIKTLTGSDTIRARFLHENSFEFKPQFKLFVNTNHLPRVTDSTVFSSDRIKVILFSRHFEENERDPNLKRLFSKKENSAAVLNWCIDGLRAYLEEGLTVPDSVKAATESYMLESDDIALFINERLEVDYKSEVSTSEAYDIYKFWCENNGFRQKSIKTFSQDLKQHNLTIITKRPKGGGNAKSIIIARKLVNSDSAYIGI